MPVTTPLDVKHKHKWMLWKDATLRQQQFYAAFPAYRGVSDRSLDPEILEAVLIAALTFGTLKERVFIFAPLAHEAWVLSQFNDAMGIIFEGCKKLPNRAVRARTYGAAWKKIAIAGRLLHFEKEPERWVSFGFAKDDPVPDWMPPRLL